jgi:hypothetical protein
METLIAGRIRAYIAIFWDLSLSIVGCFVLRRCFRLVGEGGDGSGTTANACSIGQARGPLAYAGAALIMLALASNEQPKLIRAPSRTHS